MELYRPPTAVRLHGDGLADAALLSAGNSPDDLDEVEAVVDALAILERQLDWELGEWLAARDYEELQATTLVSSATWLALEKLQFVFTTMVDAEGVDFEAPDKRWEWETLCRDVAQDIAESGDYAAARAHLQVATKKLLSGEI